jgi:hypothetical protein
MKIFLLLVCSAILFSGCNKKSATAETANPSANPVPQAGETKSGPPPAFITANADNAVRENVGGQADPFLTAQLRQFIAKNNRLPTSFAEFAKKSLDSVPRPPAGMKWIIDSADGSVKSAPIN